MICFFLLPAQIRAAEVTDQLGRKMRIPDNPMRIIALAPSITEIIFAISREKRLVGVTRFSDYPAEAEALPKVGSYVQLNLERIISLRPDLCIAVKDGNPVAVIRRIESFGIPVYAVDPKNVRAVVETIREIGELLNACTEAGRVAYRMQKRIQTIRSGTEALEKRPSVFFQIGISPIVSVGTYTFIHELIGLAGGISLTAGSTPYPRYTKEQVIALSPDIFIITSMARQTVFEEIQKEWKQWGGIPAVRNGRIHLVDSNLYDRAAPRLADGLSELLRLIHPDIWETLPVEMR